MSAASVCKVICKSPLITDNFTLLVIAILCFNSEGNCLLFHSGSRATTVASYGTYSYYIELRIRDKLGYQLIHVYFCNSLKKYERSFATPFMVFEYLYRASFVLK